VPVLRKFRTLLALPPETRRLALVSFLISLGVTLSFRLLGVISTQRRLRAWAESGSRSVPGAGAEDLIRSVRRAQLLVRRNTGFEGSCLVRSLTMWALLLRMGVSVDLRIGMRKREGKIEGHAWVEYQGTPLNEAPSTISTYHVYDRPIAFDI
jgi:hypothetical protein